MKILHVITSLQTGGAEKLMVEIIPQLRNLGNDVDLLVFNGVYTPFYKELERKGVRIYNLGYRNNVYDVRNLLNLIKFFRKNKYDIIHTHNTAPQLFIAILPKLSHIKITTEHSTSNRRRKWKWYVMIDRWMYSKYDKIICISDQAEINLKEYLGNSFNNKIITIYNGVDIERYRDASPLLEIKEKFAKYKTGIMVAGFRHEKDQETIIRAYTHLPSHYHFLFIGSGKKMNDCKRMVQKLGLVNRIHFLGSRMDVPNLLKSVDFIVMSSHYEGLSLSSIEGMASGRPFIASNVGGLKEIVEGYGLLFEHQNERELSNIILTLDKDRELYNTIVKQCQARASMYDISVMARQYNGVYLNNNE